MPTAAALDTTPLRLASVTASVPELELNLRDAIVQAYPTDADYAKLVDSAQSDPYSAYKLHDGLLYFEPPGATHARLYVPNVPALRTRLLVEAHDTPVAGHLSRTKTFERLARHFWWPRMDRTVTTYVNTCLSCQRNKHSNTPTGGKLMPMPFPSRPFI